MKAESGVFGEGGAVFLGMRCMGVAGALKSAGSLNSGTGELVSKNRALFRGTAGQAIAAILETAAGELSKAPLEAERMKFTFVSSLGQISGEAAVTLTVVKNNGPASLIVAATFNGGDGCPKMIDLAGVHGQDGSVIVEPLDGEQGDLLAGDLAPSIMIHGKGIATRSTQEHGAALLEVIADATLAMNEAETTPADPNQAQLPGILAGRVIRRSGKDIAADQGEDQEPDELEPEDPDADEFNS